MSLGILLVFGNSFILHEVNLWWEVPMVQDQELEGYKVGVVLGGYAYYNPENERIVFRESTDRLMQGIRLLKTGKIDKLLLSGGSGFILKPEQREAVFVNDFLREIGIRKNQIILETESRNTWENARETQSILENRELHHQSVLLITSARHMRRAQACFDQVGLTVVPYSTDIMTGKREYGLDHLLIPNAYALTQWNALLHEWLGFASYWVMGYV